MTRIKSTSWDPRDEQDGPKFVEEHWIGKVATTPDTPLRTHRITLTYSKFAECLNSLIFQDPSPATAGPTPVADLDPTAGEVAPDEIVDNAETVSAAAPAPGSAGVSAATQNANASPTPEDPEINGPDLTKDAVSNANWFHFATWGTYTLGPNIRNDSAPQRLDSLPSALRRWITPAILHSRSANGDLVGRALSWGQELIFLSSGQALIRFQKVAPVMTPGYTFETPPARRKELCDMVNAHGTIWINDGHLILIDEAFDSYGLARRRVRYIRSVGDDPSRDPIVGRLVLFGTILLTMVEQDLVTSALQTVTDAVPVRVMGQLDGRLASYIAKRRGLPRQVVALNLLDQISPTSAWLTDAWARFMTKEVLVIVLPAQTLRLGEDVPPLDYTAPLYPDPLDNFSSEPSGLETPDRDDRHREKAYLSELDRTVRSLNRSANDGVGSAARDWRRFDDRLNWAICLFRSRQQDPSLFWAPYSEEDGYRIVHGSLPRGRSLDGVIPPLDPTTIANFLGFKET